MQAMSEKIAREFGRIAPVRRVLRSAPLAHVLGRYIKRQIRFLGGSSSPEAIRILMFSAYRFRQDIEVMCRHPRLSIYSIDQRLLEIVHAIFSEPGRQPNKQYFLESDPVLLALRERKRAYIKIIAETLKRAGFNCAITPSIQYSIEHDWAAAFDEAGLPFIGLHKEFTVIDEGQLPMRIEQHRKRKQRFLGTQLFVTNETARTLFSRAEVFPAERIKKVGLLRMDRLLRSDSPFRQRPVGRPKAVLFSFGHLSGGFGGVERRSHYFSAYDHAGFVELFRQVHVAFAELALQNPQADFLIKMKHHVRWWMKEIEAVVEHDLGMTVDAIPNLAMVDVTAPELIRDANAVVGFNSTVLLESQALKRSTIIPRFAEAAGELSQYVYLTKYFDLFGIARSKSDLKQMVETALAEPEAFVPADESRWRAMICDYLGYDDGQTLARLVSAIEACIDGQSWRVAA